MKKHREVAAAGKTRREASDVQPPVLGGNELLGHFVTAAQERPCKDLGRIFDDKT